MKFSVARRIVFIGVSSIYFTSGLYVLQPLITFAVASKPVQSPYVFNFDQGGLLHEAGDMSLSTSPYWWVNSGAYLNVYWGRGHTNEKSLPQLDPWRVLYAAVSPVDTDNGYHPQNIFRLITRSVWQDAGQTAYFIIDRDNVSTSPNRNASNGLLLLNRYQDGNNLYYTGIRVDGSAVIKKKKNGTYTTLAQNYGVYPGTYDRDTNPSLLPKGKWIGLRSEVQNLQNGTVNIKLYIDKGWTGIWQLVAEATDVSNAITQGGYGGIRTDFMDVQFENFRFWNL